MGIKQFTLRAIVASSVVACATMAFAQEPATQALLGTWDLTLNSPQGAHPATVTIKEEAGKLAGAMTGVMGSLPVDVKTTETGVSLSFTVDYQGQPLPVVMAGKVDGATIKGTVDYGNGSAHGDFTGTKASATAGAAAGPQVGVGGTWTIASDGGSGWVFELTQDGSKVGGVLKNAGQGLTLPVQGTIENGALSLTIGGEASGTLNGTLDSSGLLKGSYVVDGNRGNFSATRKP